MSDSRYPIGKYEPQAFSNELKEQWLADVKFLPQAIESAINNLDEHQLQTPYREGGWTVHQVVHHVADSHLNAYCRFKLGYTEGKATIRPYEEKLWAETADVKNLPVNISITLLFARSEERRVGKSVDLGGRRMIKKKNKNNRMRCVS